MTLLRVRLLLILALLGPTVVWAGGNKASTARVTKPVPGLYNAINPKTTPKGWTFEDFKNDWHLPANAVGTATRVRFAGTERSRGVFYRGYVPSDRHLIATVAYLRARYSYYGNKDATSVPSWIDTGGEPLVEGKGIPTVSYMTLRFLRQMDVPYAGLRKASFTRIINPKSRLDLDELEKRGVSVNEGVKATHTYQYAETALTQSGHRITSAEVVYGKKRGDEIFEVPFAGPVRRLFGGGPSRSAFDGYDLVLTLAPIE